MQRIIPEPTPSLNQTFNSMFGKYLTPVWETFTPMTDSERLQAEEDIQDDILHDLRSELESANLVTYNAPIEVQLDYDNLIEWLRDYYRLEKK